MFFVDFEVFYCSIQGPFSFLVFVNDISKAAKSTLLLQSIHFGKTKSNLFANHDLKKMKRHNSKTATSGYISWLGNIISETQWC